MTVLGSTPDPVSEALYRRLAHMYASRRLDRPFTSAHATAVEQWGRRIISTGERIPDDEDYVGPT